MEIREATRDDAAAIRSVAHDSLSSSYSHFLGDDVIDDAVDQWYSDDVVEEQLESESGLFLVADTEEEEVVAFSQSELVGENHDIGQILWLHVDPEHRERGTGVRMLVRTREELLASGADDVRAVVLEENERGNEFYETNGFERAGAREVEIGDETYTENVYVASEIADLEAEDGWRALEPYELEDETVYVSYGEAARGANAPFYSAYESEEGTERYGWFCGNCDSLENTMDTMGRIECNRCGNRRKATRWDASYL